MAELSWEITQKALPNEGQLDKVKQVQAKIDLVKKGPLFVYDINKSDNSCKTESKKILTSMGITWDTEV